MSYKILVQGPSGTGKSTSFRNIPASEAAVITPNDKPLPFPGSTKNYVKGKNLFVTAEVGQIPAAIKHISDKLLNVKYILVEDFTHYQNSRMMQDSFVSNKGFEKWNVFGKDMFNAVASNVGGLRDDLFIFFNSHVDINAQGESAFRSSGKLLGNTIDVPSYFTYIYHTDVLRKDNAVEYRFQTNSDGTKQAKTPMGLHDSLFIPNDAYEVVKAIKKYQEGE